ncbi:MAG: hypothetical protein KatS3mg061_2646 [Dehalococcoidia bacterium]|nr:MAG: hypothetical protein KatS3mg061_2646 [Dehalococcoidia bacterium]
MKLFDGLVFQADDGKIQPGLAERWDVSSDATRYTFTLRANAKWSDGKPITAKDVSTP